MVCNIRRTPSIVPTKIFTHISDNKIVRLPGMKNFNLQYFEKYPWETNETLRHGGTSNSRAVSYKFSSGIFINKKVDILSPKIDLSDLTIRVSLLQNECAHQVSLQNDEKQKIFTCASHHLISPSKKIPLLQDRHV